MKKIIFALLSLLIFCSATYADSEKEIPFKIYKSNYMVFGDKDDQVKGQFSFKYALIYPFNLGLYFGYTQVMFWDLYEDSAPFRELNYNPEVFWRHDFSGLNNFIQLGFYEHKSNGRDGLESRGWDRGYVQAGVSYGDFINVGVDIKAFYMYQTSAKNRDIQEYIGMFEAEIYAQVVSKGKYLQQEKLYARGGVGGTYFGNYPSNIDIKNKLGWNSSKYWIESGFKFRIFTAYIQPYFYVQTFHGYAEDMIDYNKKETRFRVGLIME
jgi:phospholipase A1